MLLKVRDHDHHGSLLVHIMQRARKAKLAGATAFEALEGFGASGHIHRTRSMTDDAPVVLIIVDRPERIDAFLEQEADLLKKTFITLSDVTVIEL
jgi:hypothetical protein